MTVQRNPSPAASPASHPNTSTIAPTKALALLTSPTPPPIIDTRSFASHLLERITNSLHNPSPTSPTLQSSPILLFYDSGSFSLSQPFSTSAASIANYQPFLPHTTQLLLLQGGLPAIRHFAPHLIDADPAAAHTLRSTFTSIPWALRLLDQLVQEAEPPGKVLPWLFVAAASHAYDKHALISQNFTHIIVAGGELKPRFPNRFHYLKIPARDTPTYDLKQHFPGSVAFLDDIRQRYQSGQSVKCLVHCFAGASRSVAIVVAYLVWSLRVSAEHALQIVKDARKAAQPNHGFLKQLKIWETEVANGSHRHVRLGPSEILIQTSPNRNRELLFHNGPEDGQVEDEEGEGEEEEEEAEEKDDDDENEEEEEEEEEEDDDDDVDYETDDDSFAADEILAQDTDDDDDDDDDGDDDDSLQERIVEEEPLVTACPGMKSANYSPCVAIPATCRISQASQQRAEVGSSTMASPVTPNPLQAHRKTSGGASDDVFSFVQNESGPKAITLTHSFHFQQENVESSVSANPTLTTTSQEQPTWISDFSDMEQDDSDEFLGAFTKASSDSSCD